MAASTRSPSPTPSRPSSPNHKTLENSSASSKSGTFRLKKPCSDILRRSSGFKSASSVPSPSPIPSFEKDDERDSSCSKSVRRRLSPVINQCMGTRSYMAPTISASSKISAATPKKKVLTERNEDSMENHSALVDGEKMVETKLKSEVGFDRDELSCRKTSRILDSSFPLHHVAPLDADPSVPYDPMTNYLSPRPQFLHYKPNPRIEQLQGFVKDFTDVGDGRRLENSFTDSDGTNDSSDYTDGTLSSPMGAEPEDEPLSMAIESLEALISDQTQASEPKPRTHKTSLFKRSKLVTGILFICIVSCLVPMSDSPIIPLLKKAQSVGSRELPFQVLQDLHLKGYSTLAIWNLQGLATRIRHWPTSLGAFVSSSRIFLKEELEITRSINTMDSSSKGQKVKEACKVELTVEANKDWILGKREKGDHPIYEDISISEEVDGKAQKDEVVDPSIDAAVVYQMLKENVSPEYDKVHKEHPEKIDTPISDEVNVGSNPEGFQIMQKLEEEDLANKHLAAGSQMLKSKVQSCISANISLTAALGMLAVVLFATALAILFMRRKKSLVSSVDKLPKKKIGSVSASAKRSKNANDSYCTIAEVVGDSGLTEMSSSLNNNSLSFIQQRRVGSHEVIPRQEIMLRRDSGVFSSISYGSFTTFEKLSAKKGNKDEEAITPVRRSNRIRNQAIFFMNGT